MRRLRAGGLKAACLALLLAASSLPAQPVTPPPIAPELAERLKQAVDRALARMVRDLRTELHGIIDEAAARGDAGGLEAFLKGLESGEAAPVAPPGQERPPPPPPATRITALEARLARLREGLGADDPQVREIEAAVRELKKTLGPGPAAPQPAELLGFTASPVSAEYRTLHRLGAEEGVRILQVAPGGPADAAGLVAGDVVVRLAGPFPDPPCWLVRFISGTTGVSREVFSRCREEDLPAGARSERELTPELDLDPKSFVDRALKDAIRKVLPRQQQLEVPPAEPKKRSPPGGDDGQGPPRQQGELPKP